MHATWTALARTGTMPYVLVCVRSLASAALAFFMNQLWCTLNIRCGCIQTPSQHVACALYCVDQFVTHIVPLSLGRTCFLWPGQDVNSAASVFAVSNCSPCVLAHSMISAAQLSSIETIWWTLFQVVTYPRSSTKDSPSGSDTYSSTHMISPEVLIAQMIGNAGETCRTPAFTRCHSMVLPRIIISSVLAD